MPASTARFTMGLALLVAVNASVPATRAEDQYGPGVSDKEVKIGNIAPYSGPASAYAMFGKAEAAYFKKVNEEGGVNGRKIVFISYDDAYSPPKAVEQARKLVESDEVLLIFSPVGTPSNSAIARYLNGKKVPQLFVASYTDKWNDPKVFPWTMGLGTSYSTEGAIYAKYIVKERPNAKIGVLYQNDDAGKELLKGLKRGLGENAKMIVSEKSYEVSEPTIESHVVELKSTGADVFVSFATPKFAAQSIKKAFELDWHPLFVIPNVSSSVGATLKPAGFDKSQGIISATYLKDALDPQWGSDEGMKRYLEFLDKYMPGVDRTDNVAAAGYLAAQTMVQVLKQCGNDLTRETVMRQAASLKGFQADLLIPGIKINTGADDYSPIKDMQLMRFVGDRWQLFGEVITGTAKD